MLQIDFERPEGIFCPDETFTLKFDVQSMFKIKCKYVEVQLRCPYRKDLVEEFRIVEIANQRITTTTADEGDDTDYRVGGKGLCSHCHYIVCIDNLRRVKAKSNLLKALIKILC